ncbi:GTPase [Marinitenerispora sediminis]
MRPLPPPEPPAPGAVPAPVEDTAPEPPAAGRSGRTSASAPAPDAARWRSDGFETDERGGWFDQVASGGATSAPQPAPWPEAPDAGWARGTSASGSVAADPPAAGRRARPAEPAPPASGAVPDAGWRRPPGGDAAPEDPDGVPARDQADPLRAEGGDTGRRASGDRRASDTGAHARVTGEADAPAEERGTDTAAEPAASGDTAERPALPRRGSHGRHAAPSRRSAAGTEGRARDEGAADADGVDPDDPDDLAGWVGSLAEAVDDDAIAGRRTGPQPRYVAYSVDAPVEAGDDHPAEAAAADGGADGGEHRATAPEPETAEPAAAAAEAPPADGAPDAADPAGADGDAAAEPAKPAPGAAEPVPEPAAPDARPEAEAPAESEAADAEPEPVWTPSTVSVADEDDEYQPVSREMWQPMPATTREELIARLDGLAVMLEIGGDDIDPEAATRSRQLLNHAGARLRLSADHTVVALAGGTGSGKSSLFNALCGLEFSRVGITRPTTSSAHACVWGTEGADGLLDWLGVPPRYRRSRTSELDRGESELTGLILLDLPDHDSVRAAHTVEADRLIGAVDLLIWVLDPQKYADAAVHHRYLAEMAGHGAVTVAVLNQVDRVDSEEVEELLTDLRRLLETESGVQPRVLTTSTVTEEGIPALRDLLKETVTERRAAIDRLVADLDRVTKDFEPYSAAVDAPTKVPDAARESLTTELAGAGGVAALADAVETAHERRGTRMVGWPITRWLRRLRRDPLRSMRLDFLHDDLTDAATAPVGAQQAEIDTAVGAVADEVAQGLPAPWPRRVRAAGRGVADEVANELGTAIAGTVPDAKRTPSWWRVVRVLHYLLVAMGGAGLAWLGVVVAAQFTGGLTGLPVLNAPVFIGFAGAVVAAALAVGWLTGVGCRNLVSVAAARQREQVTTLGRERVAAVVAEKIIAPIEAELAEYRRFTSGLRAARGEETS